MSRSSVVYRHVLYLQPSEDQVTALLGAFSNTDKAREKGIHFNGAHYTCCRADANSVYAKKVTMIRIQ